MIRNIDDFIVRGLASSGEKWVYGYIHTSSNNEDDKTYYIQEAWSGKEYKVDEDSVGAKIGLEDFNKEPIYELDIVACQLNSKHNYFGIVVYNQIMCAYTVAFPFSLKGFKKLINKVPQTLKEYNQISFLDIPKYEVVGNIIDNPEVLL